MAIGRGETGAFEELFARHQANVYATALKLVKSADLAEDICQETFLSLWRGRSTFRPLNGSSVESWVRAIARNRSIDLIRRVANAKRPPTYGVGPLDLPDLSSEHPYEELLEREEVHALRNQLRGSLLSLPAAQAQVILLAFIRDLSHSEIASKLALPEGTVKGRIRLGRARMRSHFAATQAAPDAGGDGPWADPVSGADDRSI